MLKCRCTIGGTANVFPNRTSRIPPVFPKNLQVPDFHPTFKGGSYSSFSGVFTSMYVLRMSWNQFGDGLVVPRNYDSVAGFGFRNGRRQPGLEVLY